MKLRQTGDQDARMVDFLYEEMDPSMRQDFEEKLDQDETLRVEVRDNLKVLQLFRENLEPAQVSTKVQAMVMEAAAQRASRPRWIAWLSNLGLMPNLRYALGTVLSLVLLLGAVVLVYRLKGMGLDRRPQRPSESGHTKVEAKTTEKKNDKGALVADGRTRTTTGGARYEDELESAEAGAKGEEEGPMGKNGIDDVQPTRPKSSDEPSKERTRDKNASMEGVFASVADSSKSRPDPLKQTKVPVQQAQKGAVPAQPPQSKGGNRKLGLSSTRGTGTVSLVLARKLQTTGKHRQAIQIFTRLANDKDDSRRNQALLSWARSEMALGRYNKANQILNRVKNATKDQVAETSRLRRSMRRTAGKKQAPTYYKVKKKRPINKKKAPTKQKRAPTKVKSARPVPGPSSYAK